MMGVTLERVQLKFACIIGELSSQPDLLSQFAIWLDLRIAEFKAKGAISLECSGKYQNPDWLRGYRLNGISPVEGRVSHSFDQDTKRNCVTAKPTCSRDAFDYDRNFLQAKSFHQDPPKLPTEHLTSPHLSSPFLKPCSSRLTVPSSSSSPFDTTGDRLSPDVIAVEKESDVVVGKICGSTSTQLLCSSRRRRFSKTLTTGKVREETDTVGKVRIVETASGNGCTASSPTIEPVNETLLSIIGREADHKDGIPDAEVMYSVGDTWDSPGQCPYGSAEEPWSAPTKICQSEGAQYPGHSPDFSADIDQTRLELLESSPDEAGEALYLYPGVYPSSLSTGGIRQRIVNLDTKPQQTVFSMVKALSTLERWWWMKYNERRHIETMPIQALDNYLTEFFTVLVRSDNRDYEPEYALKLRSYLDRFLREHKYPVSISKSKVFYNSQEALRKKRKILSGKKCR